MRTAAAIAISLLLATTSFGLRAVCQTSDSAKAPSTPTATPDVSSASDRSRVYRYTEPGIKMPQLIRMAQPDRPKDASSKKICGKVVVGFVVDAQGVPQNVHVERSAVEEVKEPADKEMAAKLDPKAVEAISQYRFAPAKSMENPLQSSSRRCWTFNPNRLTA